MIGLLIVFAIPSIVLFFKFPNGRGDVVVQGIITLALLFIGWRLIKISGCTLRLIGIAMVLLGLAAYYFLIIQPILTGELVTLGFINFR